MTLQLQLAGTAPNASQWWQQNVFVPCPLTLVNAPFPSRVVPGVNFKTWGGVVMGTRYGVAVYVLNQRVGSVLTAASAAATAACGAEFQTSAAPAAQMAVQSALLKLLLSKGSPRERLDALSSPDDVAAVFELALAGLSAPEAGLGTCKLPEDGEERLALFATLAKVRHVSCDAAGG